MIGTAIVGNNSVENGRGGVSVELEQKFLHAVVVGSSA